VTFQTHKKHQDYKQKNTKTNLRLMEYLYHKISRAFLESEKIDGY